MKYYFLNSGWEIVPHAAGVKVFSLDQERTYNFSNSKSIPDMIGFFHALSKGIGESAIFSDYKIMAANLSEKGIVSLRSNRKIDSDSNRYLDLLSSQFVGTGKMIGSITEARGENVFAVEAHGLASRLIKYQPSLNYAWGCDSDFEMAKIKAIVEYIERMALAEYHPDLLYRAPWNEMSQKSMSARQLNTTEKCLKKAGDIEWDCLENFGGEQIYAPLDFLHHPVDYWALGRWPVCPMDISGIAGHQSTEAATVNSLLELCEHEALMVAWFGKRVCPTIDPDSLDAECRGHIGSLIRKGWQVIIKDITLDLVPVVMAVAIGPEGKRALMIGSNAAFSTKYAAKKAILEVVRTIILDETKGTKLAPVRDREVMDVLAHERHYFFHANLKYAEHLWKGGRVVDADNKLTYCKDKGRDLGEMTREWDRSGKLARSEMDYLTKIFKQEKIEFFTKDITPREVSKLNMPLKVIRAVAPEMARLVVGYGQEPAKTKRFCKLVSEFGSKSGCKVYKIHPFC